MAKKKLPVSIFEIIWYIICALVIIWGLTYVSLALIDKYNDLDSLHKFITNFKNTFGLSLYFWGLIIIAIGVVAAVTVMVIFAKTYDRAADREQRRSARLNALKKEDKVVDEQKPEVVEEKPAPAPVEEPKQEEPVEQPAEEAPKVEEPVEQPAEELATEEVQPEEAPTEEKPAEQE